MVMPHCAPVVPAAVGVPRQLIRPRMSSTFRAVESQPGNCPGRQVPRHANRHGARGSDSHCRITAASTSGWSFSGPLESDGGSGQSDGGTWHCAVVTLSPDRLPAGQAQCLDGAGSLPDDDRDAAGQRFGDHQPERFGPRHEQAQVRPVPFVLQFPPGELAGQPHPVVHSKGGNGSPDLRRIGGIGVVRSHQGCRPGEVLEPGERSHGQQLVLVGQQCGHRDDVRRVRTCCHGCGVRPRQGYPAARQTHAFLLWLPRPTNSCRSRRRPRAGPGLSPSGWLGEGMCSRTQARWPAAAAYSISSGAPHAISPSTTVTVPGGGFRLRFPGAQQAAQPPSFLGAGVRPGTIHGQHFDVDAQGPQSIGEPCVVDVAAGVVADVGGDQEPDVHGVRRSGPASTWPRRRDFRAG